MAMAKRVTPRQIHEHQTDWFQMTSLPTVHEWDIVEYHDPACEGYAELMFSDDDSRVSHCKLCKRTIESTLTSSYCFYDDE
jgi:hypothetical protein